MTLFCIKKTRDLFANQVETYFRNVCHPVTDLYAKKNTYTKEYNVKIAVITNVKVGLAMVLYSNCGREHDCR